MSTSAVDKGERVFRVIDLKNRIIFCLCMFMAIQRTYAQNNNPVTDTFLFPPDSIMKNYTLEELQDFRSRYLREISRLENERDQLRQQGIRDAEFFLSNNPKSKVGDKVLMRLGELYYERAHDDFHLQMQDYDRQFALYEKGESSEEPKEPRKDLSAALHVYRQVIMNYPHSDLVDDAYYNIAFSSEEAFQSDSAVVYYNKIIHEFSDSPLLPDVYMRMGEYYFNPPKNDLLRAVGYYEKVLPFKDTPRYDESLYRLGWCYYRLKEYSKAIAYFTLLADDIYKTRPYDPMQKYSNPSLVDEAIEYMGLSFLDHGGPEAAVKYLTEIGGRDYGVDVLKRMGNAYMDEKENYQMALIAYNRLLELYPFSSIAPSIQNRVVQSYRRLDNSVMAFYCREALFENYKEGSEWWLRNHEKKARQQAYILTESALRDNISVLINRGQETDQADLFEQSVIESRKYLAIFRADSSAPLIHWNMALTLDTKLRRIDEAYQEYMIISHLYWDTRYQRYAAENAVALAREAALSAIATAEEQAAGQRKITLNELRQQATQQKSFNFREQLLLKPMELSPAEIKLAQAYENYITLFPHTRETPLFLANAGVLYYRRNNFKEALKYFNTLLKHFPDSNEVAQTRYAIMESYFGKGDFNSSEIIARRIINSDVSDDLRVKSRRRLAESIFLNAEIMARQEQHLEAGNEYRRVVKEASSIPFADLALFNAALEYDQAGDFIRAMETYRILEQSHPSSPHVLDAQNNLAFDYAELGEYKNAAMVYEKIAATHPDPEKARDALYNSSLYYVKANDWNNSIRANHLFVDKYPDDDSADELAFEIPGFYQQLSAYDKAQDSFDDYTEKYPTSPRAVEAFFKRGEYFNENGQTDNAILEYEKAIAKNKNLGKSGNVKNDYIAAEAEFALALLKNKEFYAITFRLPESDMVRSKQRKKDLLLELVHHLGNAASYGTFRLYEATYLIGVVYQNFASTWSIQEIPRMDETRMIVAKKEVNDAAVELYDRATQAHKNTIIALTNLAVKYQENLLREIKQDTIPDLTFNAVAGDSILQNIQTWVEKAKEKFAETNYQKGELSLKSAQALLSAPIPKGLGDFPELVYRKQVIDVAVTPLTGETAASFQVGLSESDSLKIDNQWTRLSLHSMIKSKNLVPLADSRLAMAGLNLIDEKLQAYHNVLYSRRDNKALLNELQTSHDELINIIEFSQKCILSMSDHYAASMSFAESLNLPQQFTESTRDSFMTNILKFAQKCDSSGVKARKQANIVRDKFIQSSDPVLEEGLFAFENYYLTLKDAERNVLETTYASLKKTGTDLEKNQGLVLQLMRFDPEQYAPHMGMSIQEYSVTGDTTWKVSSQYSEGWTLPDFSTQNWTYAEWVINQSTSDARRVWLYEKQPSALTEDQTLALLPGSHVFFRKSLVVDGLPVFCEIRLETDGNYNLYFNGDHIVRAIQTEKESSGGIFDVTDFLVHGRNYAAVEVIDDDHSAHGLYVNIVIKFIPGWEEKVKQIDKTAREEQIKASSPEEIKH